MNKPSPNCPQCGECDQVQPLTDIVNDDPTIPLSRMLAPPTQPVVEAETSWAKIGGFIFIAGGILSILATLFVILPSVSQGAVDSQLIQLSLSMIFGLGIVGGGIATMRSNAKKTQKKKAHYETKLARWKIAMKRWRKLYFCARDKGVFDLDKNELIPAEQMIDYLERR